MQHRRRSDGRRDRVFCLKHGNYVGNIVRQAVRILPSIFQIDGTNFSENSNFQENCCNLEAASVQAEWKKEEQVNRREEEEEQCWLAGQ